MFYTGQEVNNPTRALEAGRKSSRVDRQAAVGITVLTKSTCVGWILNIGFCAGLEDSISPPRSAARLARITQPC